MIKNGVADSESDLARQLGISRVRVNQIIRLLKLEEIINSIERLGDPLSSRIVTERMLRQYVGRRFKDQQYILQAIIKNAR